jgi:hypothetical protein
MQNHTRVQNENAVGGVRLNRKIARWRLLGENRTDQKKQTKTKL